MKTLSLIPILFLVACSNAQLRQDDNDYDRARLQIYQANTAAKNAIAAREAEAMADAVKEICKIDANPGLCLAVTINKSQSVTAQVEQIPHRTPVPENKFWTIAANLTGKVLDVGLSAYGISEGNKTSRYGIDANKDLILGLTDNIGRNAGTHLGAGAEYYAGDYAQDNSDNSDHSIDRSVSVGGDQNIAGRDVINGQVGDDVGGNQTIVGEDQYTAGSDLAVGDANFNTGRIGSDGPFVDCVSGDTGNSTGGPGASGSSGGSNGTSGTGLVQCTPGE